MSRLGALLIGLSLTGALIAPAPESPHLMRASTVLPGDIPQQDHPGIDCHLDFPEGNEGESCLPALSIRSSTGTLDNLAGEGELPILENAVAQAAYVDDATAEAFINNARDDLNPAQLAVLDKALRGSTSSTAGPETPLVKTTGTISARRGIGNPRYQTAYVDYWNIRSDGSTRRISTTRLEFFHYIGINTSDWGKKAIAVHLTKSTGRDTYYSDVVCEMKHVDAFADSVVLRWGACGNPIHSTVNNWDLYRSERDYYGNRGDKYYNEIWADINPAGSAYRTLRANREGPKWRNPSGGGEPTWL